MLEAIRTIAKTWVARILFGALVVAFGLWGVAGSLRSIGTDTAAARVGGTRIEAADLARAFHADLTRQQQQNGPGFQPSAQDRRQIAAQAAQQLVYQRLIDLKLASLGVTVPDAALRAQVFGMPAFQDNAGKFNHQLFDSVLSRNGLDESGFLVLVRQDLGRQQLLGAISAGIRAPDAMVGRIFAYARETRTATLVRFPTSAAPAIPTPTNAQLKRFWQNNPDRYRTPQLRTARIIVLSPETLASQVSIGQTDIAKYYDAMLPTYQVPELRSLQILAAPTQAAASSLATLWQAGADWASLKQAATRVGATALDLKDARRAALPDQTLAATAFTTPAGTISAPVHGQFNWYVVKPLSVTPALDRSLADATPEIRQKLAVLKAADQMDDRVTRLEDALAGGGGLAALPAGLGLAAVEGTLDAKGNTRQGQPAPIPAWPALRTAIVQAVFAARPGAPADLQQLPADKDHPAGAWYAVEVTRADPPSRLPFASVQDRVRTDWTDDQARHLQELAAAALLARVRAGMTIAAAAAHAGLTPIDTPPVPRPLGDAQIPNQVPRELVTPLFAMKRGEVTMVGTADGFVVAALTAITDPPISTDPIGAGQMRGQLSQSIGGDLVDDAILALQTHEKVVLNPAIIRRVAE